MARHRGADGRGVPHHHRALWGEPAHGHTGAEVVAHLASDELHIRTLQAQHEVDLRGAGQAGHVRHQVQHGRLGRGTLGLDLLPPPVHSLEEGCCLVNDQGEGLEVSQAGRAVLDLLVALHHQRVGVHDHLDLMLQARCHELHVRPRPEADELDALAVQDPRAPPGLSQTLCHVVLHDRFSRTGLAGDQQVRLLSREPREHLAVLVHPQRHLEILVGLMCHSGGGVLLRREKQSRHRGADEELHGVLLQIPSGLPLPRDTSRQDPLHALTAVRHGHRIALVVGDLDASRFALVVQLDLHLSRLPQQLTHNLPGPRDGLLLLRRLLRLEPFQLQPMLALLQGLHPVPPAQAVLHHRGDLARPDRIRDHPRGVDQRDLARLPDETLRPTGELHRLARGHGEPQHRADLFGEVIVQLLPLHPSTVRRTGQRRHRHPRSRSAQQPRVRANHRQGRSPYREQPAGYRRTAVHALHRFQPAHAFIEFPVPLHLAGLHRLAHTRRSPRPLGWLPTQVGRNGDCGVSRCLPLHFHADRPRRPHAAGTHS